jgi:uncharacterized protein YciI
MRSIILLIACSFAFIAGFAQKTPSAYDSVLARSVGADPYGMKKYIMAFLKDGPNKTLDSAQRQALQIGHLKNITRLAKEGRLVVAGPFLDNWNVAGIFIFNVATVEEAKALVATDPAVKAGIFEMELHPWYASAALMQVVPIHNKIQKISITD